MTSNIAKIKSYDSGGDFTQTEVNRHGKGSPPSKTWAVIDDIVDWKPKGYLI